MSIHSQHFLELTGGKSNLVDLLLSRSLHEPNRVAYTFLVDGELDELKLTYGELNQRACSIGSYLQSLGMAGERVLLLFPPGPEFISAFFGCLYAGAVAIPLYPPRANKNLSRLQSVVADADAVLSLTTSVVLSRLKPLIAQNSGWEKMRWMADDSIDNDLATHWRHPAVSSSTLAYLQYTSGSTSKPKGVMVRHENLLRNSEDIDLGFCHDSDSVIVSWLPHFHDMGLIYGIIQPLYNAIPAYLMSPTCFLQQPIRWLQAISRHKATHSGGPNFSYDLCVRKIAPEQCATLDLTNWCVAFNGAEPIRNQTLDQFADAFEPYGFRRSAFCPSYGLAEATLKVSAARKNDGPTLCSIEVDALKRHLVVEATEDGPRTQALVGCGHPSPDTKVVIVDPESLMPCATDEIGEIWVASPSVVEGYWNMPIESAHTFKARLAHTGEGPFLRTGDLGFTRNGEIFVTGRLKDLIIVRGVNYYPQDIELTVGRSEPALRPGCGAAFSVDIDNQERVVVVQEVHRHYDHLDVVELSQAIRIAVAESHELSIYAVVLIKGGTIPKTSSGKIKRAACRQAFITGNLEVLGRIVFDRIKTDFSEHEITREDLLAICQDDRRPMIVSYLKRQTTGVLGIDASRVDSSLPLSALGIDSLMGVELSNRIHLNLGLVIPATTFLQESSLVDLAEDMLDQLTTEDASTLPAFGARHEAVGEHPLSYGQRALWFIHQLDPDSAAYNIMYAVRVRSFLDSPCLRRAAQALADRHVSLRTTYATRAGNPVQQVHSQMPIHFSQHDASALSEQALNDRLIDEGDRPFDLERETTLRVDLFTRSAQEHVLLLTSHHIMCDLWSLDVIMTELHALYLAERDGIKEPLDEPGSQYTDYVYWQADMLANPEGERLWEYWQKQLAGDLPPLNLPTDKLVPPTQTYRGTSFTFELRAELTERLKALAKAEGATLFMTCLSAFQILLHRYSGQVEFIIGTPTAGRSRPEFQNAVGYFVNLVVLRADLSVDSSFEALLRNVRQTVLAALAHQDYPFPLLVERLQLARDPDRPPLIQVTFAWDKPPRLDGRAVSLLPLRNGSDGRSSPRLALETDSWRQGGAAFDLMGIFQEIDESLFVKLCYNKDLFDGASIARMARHFECLLEAIVSNPKQRISEMELLGEAERHHLLMSLNETDADYPRDLCIHQMFSAQVERTPDAIALACEGSDLTYRDLNSKANRLARYLRRLGVGPETLVGLCVERSLQMVVSMLAILKAGAAYLSLDPQYPKARLALILNDAQPSVLLTQESLTRDMPQHGAREICLDTIWQTISHESDANLTTGAAPDNLAYVIYTSGSTGKPKGVMISHRALVNHMCWMQLNFPLDAADRVLQKTPFSFDASVWEFYAPLMVGAQLIIARPGGHQDCAYLVEVIAGQRITILQLVPSLLRVLLEGPGLANCVSLKRVFCGGEVLSSDLQERFFIGSSAALVNLYGPTEATIDASSWTCERESKNNGVPIGRPIANTQIYLLDRYLAPVPRGVAGELYIGGDCLARGYLNHAELTAERFIPNPFSRQPGARLYKTGDVARHLAAGSIDYIGRNDHQVKVRGFRVDLKEVEAMLVGHEGVQSAVVIAEEDNSGSKRLAAYVVAEQESPATPSQLRAFLRERLPEYMVPSSTFMLEALPRMPSGKLDYRALLSVAANEDHDSGVVSTPARTPVEEVLTMIWAEVLGVERVGIFDSFFDLGGHSLLATQVLSRIYDSLGVELPLRTFLSASTIACSADNIAKLSPTVESVEKVARIWLEVERLSNEEVEEILLQGKF